MTFDVIICTLGRQESILKLLTGLAAEPLQPKAYFLIWSGPNSENFPFERFPFRINLVVTNQRNQPYQRFLGANLSKADIFFFFDDDLEVQKKGIYERLLKAYEDPKVVGSGVGIQYDSPMDNILGVDSKRAQGKKLKNLWKLTGVPNPDVGRVGRLGVVGILPKNSSHIEYLNGPQMSFRSDTFLKIFPNRLFDLYRQNLGKGEDKFLSYSVSLRGKIQFDPDIFLKHPPAETSYFGTPFLYWRRVIVSRWFHSRLWCRERFLFFEGVLFGYYAFWRILISFFTLLLRPSKYGLSKVMGQIHGLFLVAFSSFLIQKFDWKEILDQDLAFWKVKKN